MTDFEHELTGALGGRTGFDAYTRHLYSRDASMYAIEPRGVAFPRDADDVAAAVTIAGRHGVPIVARGAGTSLAGQTVGSGLVLDLSRHLHEIVAIDPEARTARVQPGVVQDQLNRAAAAHGLMFGPDTSTSNRATLGGMIGNNSAGSGSVRHGMTIDHVRELAVVLSDGTHARFGSDRRDAPRSGTVESEIYRRLPGLLTPEVLAGFPPYWRRACGYPLDRLAAGPGFDLARFVVGSEGTLVTVTEALVDLVPRPRHTMIAVGHFTSVLGAVEATGDALAGEPSAVEMMDRTILDLSRRKIEYAGLGQLLAGDPAALLFVSFAGDDERELRGRLDRLTARWKRHGHGYHTVRAETPAQQAGLLKVRAASLGLLMAASTGTLRPLAFVEDTAVDPARLADYTRDFQKVLDRHGLHAGFYGHCSVGCLHIRPFVDVRRPEHRRAMRAVAEEIKDLVVAYGGVNSSEHGDGLARSEFNREIFGDELYAALRTVKEIFDPHGLMNPGKIVDAPPMTDHLRDAALPPAPPIRTRLDFTVVGGMRDTADRCMNIGLCRKDATGVMCPSYMATRDEEHSTRGRANALVKALSEADPRAGLSDDRLHGILDLCLMCKACKSECPLGVDMAALKAETLAARHDTHGVPLRSRLFGAIRTVNRLGAATAPLANLLTRSAPLRRLLDRRLGITAARPLPRFARTDLIRWFRHVHRPPGPEIILLADSFTTWTEPSAGQAAVTLLTAAGWRVRLESGGCCGRASYSKGLLDDARRRAAALVTRLAGSSSPIVGCEPSCVLTLRDEHRQLLPDDPRVPGVAGRVRQIEEILLDADLPLTGRFAGRRILYHGHCHQKAEVGTAATLALLRRIPGAEVVEVDAGCCGMAGSFGYESEHYDLSMTIAESRLLPAVRNEPASTIVAATGFSCRQQIRHGTERVARHPLELLLEACSVDPGSRSSKR
ncbi:FAD-binding and (Fe-S)-binding domain-containing protein [Actinoplanes rectilineatus]|uniref:FAD-binding and (Fe-S)-binding domain-containing protein n=1 Tax=Actinoplanes rectilineatus TaxID=113571 RepID=UPI0005F28E57|nr:FAD-binding and (Fe-S)-binding domain-containing protein [Actinoplanes rectilineatus]